MNSIRLNKWIALIFIFLLIIGLAACERSEDPIDEDQKNVIIYEGMVLQEGAIGTPYNASVALATGADGLTYQLKVDQTLPEGLLLSQSGQISGTPNEAVDNYTFVVIASAENANSVEATFTISILGDGKVFVFETEYTDIDHVEGGGISGAPSTPYDMILSSQNASNGYFLGFTHRTNLYVYYTINSDQQTVGTLSLRLGSEIGLMLINSAILEVTINGQVLNYSQFSIPENTGAGFVFYDYNIGDINLIQGENVIQVRVLENTLLNGNTGGPLFDNISIHTEANLVWNPIESNLN